MLTVFPKNTSNEFWEESFKKWCENDDIKYMIGQQEIAPTTNKLHYQMYVKFKTTKRMSGIKKIFGSDVHCELRKGTETQAIHYCTKKETRKEGTEHLFYGTQSEQGRRTDLEEIAHALSNYETSVDRIIEEDPEKYHQYGRTLTKIEDLAMRKRFRTEMTKGIWYCGPTGTGKSHKAFENYSPSTHYLWNLNDKGWQDGYTQQETVIINEFRGEIKFSELLVLLDKWPHNLPRRGREPIPFTSKKIIITSCKTPEEIYTHSLTDNDKLNQLTERIQVIQLTGESKRLLS